MLKVAGAGSIRRRSLTRRATTKPFKGDATGSHRAASHKSDRAGIDRLQRRDKLVTKPGR